MERDADVVVVGAGIVGCATAYYLARRGAARRRRRAGARARRAVAEELGLRPPAGARSAEMPLVVEANRHLAGPRARAGRRRRVGPGRQPRAGRRRGAHGAVRGVAAGRARVRARDAAAPRPGSRRGRARPGRRLGRRHAHAGRRPRRSRARPPTPSRARRVAHGATLHLDCAVQARDHARPAPSAGGRHRARRDPHAGGGVRGRRLVARGWRARSASTLPQRWVRGTVARTTPAPAVTACAVWGPGVAFRQRRDGSFNIAAGGALDHDVTLDSLRQVRFFLPNFWKNRALFRFHVGRPLLREPGRRAARARRRAGEPLVWDRGVEPAPNPGQGAPEPGRAAARAARAAAARHRRALGRLHRRHARPGARARRGARRRAASSSPPASAATASRWGPSPAGSSPS